MNRLLRILRTLVIVVATVAVSTLALAWAWTAIGGGAMSIHGWIALGLGILGTVVLAWVLMSLAFRSDREGWDAAAGHTLDPGPDGSD